MQKINILRPDDKGKPDDIVISCDRIHMECMDNNQWWIGIYRGNKRVCFFLTSKRKIEVDLAEDDIGLIDDR